MKTKNKHAEATAAWAEGQRAAERTTNAERGLEAAKARQVENEVVLQKSLETLELERNALVSERNALELA